MDIFTLFFSKICFVCLKRPKINEKEAEDGPFKKILSSRLGRNERNRELKIIHLMLLINFGLFSFERPVTM